MLGRLRSLGIKTLLVSSGFTFFTEHLKKRLSLNYPLSNTLEFGNGKLTGKALGGIVDARIKAAKLRELRDALRLSCDQVIAFGDGTNDIAMTVEASVFHCISRQAGGAGKSELLLRLCWAGWAVESLRSILRTLHVQRRLNREGAMFSWM